MIADILRYRGYTVGEDGSYDAVINERGFEMWNHADAQPTPEQLASWAAEPAFATWLSEHGGDALLTLRREAKEMLDAQADRHAALMRALAMTTLSEVNILRDWITQFKAATAAATTLANLQTRVAALPAVPTRTSQQLRDAIKKQVTDGNVDV